MRRSTALILTALLLLLTGSVTFSQAITGRLRGQILDPSGGAVPQAQVVVTNQRTGVTSTLTTTSAGTYELPSILPGLYKVSVEAKGFKGFLKIGIPVLADRITSSTFSLNWARVRRRSKSLPVR